MKNITDVAPQQQIVQKQTPKRLSQKTIIIAAVLTFLLGVITAFFFTTTHKNAISKPSIVQHSPTPTPKKDAPFGIYASPQIPKKDVYIIFMIGDSMTEALGPYGGQLDEFINTFYQSTPGHKRVVIDNYAKGSTNILGVQDAIKQKTIVGDHVLEPLLSRSFDVLLIESFGYNPLSQLGLQEGLKKQTQTLDELMNVLTTTHPHAAIIFVATIAPNKETYGQDESHNTQAEREAQAAERVAYIKNHMNYAKNHSIPLIDIYNKSLTPNGDGDIANINPNDHIHPSVKGTTFISKEIANFLYENQILSK